MCSKWASQGIQLNPFIDRATQPINSPPWYIDMGFYDPSLQFTIWAFWTKIFSSQILLMTCVALASWNMPVFLFSFRNGPQDPKAFATWYVLKAYFLSMRIRAHSIFPYLQKKFSWRKNAQAHKNYLGLLGIKSSKPIPLQNQLFRRVLRSQHF